MHIHSYPRLRDTLCFGHKPKIFCEADAFLYIQCSKHFFLIVENQIWFDLNMQTVPFWHYNDVIMSVIASQITSLTIVYCVGNSPVTREFPTQRANNAENISIWPRHHVKPCTANPRVMCQQWSCLKYDIFPLTSTIILLKVWTVVIWYRLKCECDLLKSVCSTLVLLIKVNWHIS